MTLSVSPAASAEEFTVRYRQSGRVLAYARTEWLTDQAAKKIWKAEHCPDGFMLATVFAKDRKSLLGWAVNCEHVSEEQILAAARAHIFMAGSTVPRIILERTATQRGDVSAERGRLHNRTSVRAPGEANPSAEATPGECIRVVQVMNRAAVLRCDGGRPAEWQAKLSGSIGLGREYDGIYRSKEVLAAADELLTAVIRCGSGDRELCRAASLAHAKLTSVLDFEARIRNHKMK